MVGEVASFCLAHERSINLSVFLCCLVKILQEGVFEVLPCLDISSHASMHASSIFTIKLDTLTGFHASDLSEPVLFHTETKTSLAKHKSGGLQDQDLLWLRLLLCAKHP